uniref:MSP domain-containing protein n=1 Tax=Globodera rostochiensis TaxID=31243 RepID=A0A914H7E0_GLORO
MWKIRAGVDVVAEAEQLLLLTNESSINADLPLRFTVCGGKANITLNNTSGREMTWIASFPCGRKRAFSPGTCAWQWASATWAHKFDTVFRREEQPHGERQIMVWFCSSPDVGIGTPWIRMWQ